MIELFIIVKIVKPIYHTELSQATTLYCDLLFIKGCPLAKTLRKITTANVSCGKMDI